MTIKAVRNTHKWLKSNDGYAYAGSGLDEDSMLSIVNKPTQSDPGTPYKYIAVIPIIKIFSNYFYDL